MHQGAHHDQRRQAHRQQIAEEVRRSARDTQTEESDEAERQRHPKDTHQPPLLRDQREGEIVVRFRKEVVLLCALPVTDTEHTAGAHGDQRLMQLVAGTARIGARIQERDHPGHPIARRPDRFPENRERQQAQQDEVTDARACGEQHDRAEQAHQCHRGEIGLHQDQEPDDQVDDGERGQPPAQAPQSLPLLCGQRRRPDHHRQLRELGWLYAGEPASGPVSRRRDRLGPRQHQDQESDGHETQ